MGAGGKNRAGSLLKWQKEQKKKSSEYCMLIEWGGMEASAIARESGIPYNTASKHLKDRTEEGLLTRDAKTSAKKPYENKRTPWNYYYTLNNIQ